MNTGHGVCLNLPARLVLLSMQLFRRHACSWASTYCILTVCLSIHENCIFLNSTITIIFALPTSLSISAYFCGLHTQWYWAYTHTSGTHFNQIFETNELIKKPLVLWHNALIYCTCTYMYLKSRIITPFIQCPFWALHVYNVIINYYLYWEDRALGKDERCLSPSTGFECKILWLQIVGFCKNHR